MACHLHKFRSFFSNNNNNFNSNNNNQNNNSNLIAIRFLIIKID